MCLLDKGFLELRAIYWVLAANDSLIDGNRLSCKCGGGRMEDEPW